MTVRAASEAITRAIERAQEQGDRGAEYGSVLSTDPLTVELTESRMVIGDDEDLHLGQNVLAYHKKYALDEGDNVVALPMPDGDWIAVEVLADKDVSPPPPVVVPPGGLKLGLMVAAADASELERGAADYVCDGIHDEVEIQAAVDASVPGGSIYLSGGTFNFERATTDAQQAHVFSTKSLQIRGAGMLRTKINRTTYLADFIFAGTRGANVNLISDAAKSTWVLNVSTTGLVANQYVRIKSNDQPPATNVNGRRGELVRIKSVDSPTQITLWSPLEDAYPVASVANIAPITFIEAPLMSDMGFTQPGPMAPENSRGYVRYIWCRAGRFENIYAEKGDAFAFDVYGNISTVADRLSMWDFVSDLSLGYAGYGVVARGPTRSLIVSNSYMRGGRNLFTTGSESDGMPSHNLVSNCIATEMTAPAFSVHADSRYTTFDTCLAQHTRAFGFFIQDDHTRMFNCSVDGAVGAGIFLNFTATSPTILGGVVRDIVRSDTAGGPGSNPDNNGGGAGIVVGVITPHVAMGAHIDGVTVMDTDGEGILCTSDDNYIRAFCRNNWRSQPSFKVGLRVLANTTGCHFKIHAEDMPTVGGFAISFDTADAFVNNTVIEVTARNVTNLSNYAAATNPTFINVRDFGAQGDFKSITDASVSGTALGSPSQGKFSALDEGKAITIVGAGTAGANHTTTIASVTNTTTAVLTLAAPTPITSGGTADYGTDDRQAFIDAIQAINIARGGPGGTLYLPEGGYYVDLSAGGLPTNNNLRVLGDGWGSYIRFGPELTTTIRTGFSINVGVMFTLENIRLEGMRTLGAGGSMWAMNMGGAGATTKLRNVKLRRMTHGAYASGAGSVLDVENFEIEGRGTLDSRALIHDGTSGKLSVHRGYVWDFGGAGIHGIAATTGINLDVDHVAFDTQAGSGYCIYHFDALGTAPTANTQSSVAKCTFGPATALAVRTPYQGVCKIEGNTHSGTSSLAVVSGRALIDRNAIQSSQTAATSDHIAFLNVASPVVSRGSARITNNVFMGRGRYSVYATADVDISLQGNEFNGGDATVPLSSHVRIDSGAAATSKIAIRAGNTFAGQTSNFAIQCGPGVYDVVANGFTGTFGSAAIASQGGTPTRLSVLDNNFSQAAASVSLATTPTFFERRGNYGSKAPSAGIYTGAATVPPDQASVIADPTSAAFALALPLAVQAGQGGRVTVKNKATVNNVTLNRTTADTIDGATSLALAPGASTDLVSDGATGWYGV